MPIRTVDLTASPGFIVQACANCGFLQRIYINKGATCTKDGPFNVTVDSTLEVKVDGGAPQTVTFAAGSFPNFATVTPAQLRDKLNAALTGVTCRLDESPECVVIESSSTGASSSAEVVGGSARAALGFSTGSNIDVATGRPVLGLSQGGHKNADSILLRRCNGCETGAQSHEILNRTWDTSAENSARAIHRRVVNALARWLKAQGYTHADLAAEYAAETSEPPDYLTGLPGTVLTVAPLQTSPEEG